MLKAVFNNITKIAFDFCILFLVLTSCVEKRPLNLKSDDFKIVSVNQVSDTLKTPFLSNIVRELNDNILCIFQDKSNNYWFGTNGAGVYRYDGKYLLQFTVKDGLANNQIQTIQQDSMGIIWFGTGLFGVTGLDGIKFKTWSNDSIAIQAKNLKSEWKVEANDLWFWAGAGAYHYTGNELKYLPFIKPNTDSAYIQKTANQLSAYAVYCTLKDSKGNVWFGTQNKGVCCFNGKTFKWFTEKGLAGPAVLCLFEDKSGNIWFGNNGSGLFYYDGKVLHNFTEEKGLSNKEFVVSGNSFPNTLARVYCINQDNAGKIWIGTVDAGVWCYDGKELRNYTTKQGLTSNAVNTIYKDKTGELWFGTDDKGICKFNGQSFYKFFP